MMNAAPMPSKAPSGLSRIRVASVLFAAAGAALGQTPPADVRSLVDGARLGTGYAQMIGLAATPDVSAANYDIDAAGSGPTLDVFRLPYQTRWMTLSPDADLYWKVAGGWLRLEDDFRFGVPPAADATIGSRWTAYSASGGVLAKVRLGGGFTLEPALDVSVARLENRASYSGAASALQPLFDGTLFNWQSNAWLVTPSLGLEWATTIDDAKATVRGHVARSWISSFDETDPVLSFSEATNGYSIRADYARPTGHRLADRPLSWVAYGGFAGFFGANRDALGFDSVAEVGGGIELPLVADQPKAERLRLAAGYLFGPDVRGWTLGLSLRY